MAELRKETSFLSVYLLGCLEMEHFCHTKSFSLHVAWNLQAKTLALCVSTPHFSNLFDLYEFARLGSIVVFRVRSENGIPVASEMAVNGFDSEVGFCNEEVRDDFCGKAGRLPAERMRWLGINMGRKGKDGKKGKMKKGKTDPKGKGFST